MFLVIFGCSTLLNTVFIIYRFNLLRINNNRDGKVFSKPNTLSDIEHLF